MKLIPKTITLLLTFMKIGLFTFGGGSVVVKDIPNDSVAVGNPCKVIREITEADKYKYYHREYKPS